MLHNVQYFSWKSYNHGVIYREIISYCREIRESNSHGVIYRKIILYSHSARVTLLDVIMMLLMTMMAELMLVMMT